MSNLLAYRPHLTASQAFDEAASVIENEFITDREVLRVFLPWSKKDFEYFLGENGVISNAIDLQIRKASGYRKSFLMKKWALSGDFRQETQAFKLMASEDELRRLASSYVKNPEPLSLDDFDPTVLFVDNDDSTE